VLLYEYKIRDQFESLRGYAERVRAAFDAKEPGPELLADARNLETLYDHLIGLLLQDVRGAGNCGRHIGWMIRRLEENAPECCRQDIVDICERDISDLERAFRDWCQRFDHYDKELIDKVTDLMVRQEYDSAIRKAFVILKARLCSAFGEPVENDGLALVNRVFGKEGHPRLVLENTERQAMRDLLAGLYGVFRNRFAHTDSVASWHEADAIVSMVNYVLKQIPSMHGWSK
jgi:hypothetical protein